MEIIWIVAHAITLLLLIYLIVTSKKSGEPQQDPVEKLRPYLEQSMREHRSELAQSLKDNREELAQALNRLGEQLDLRLGAIREGLEKGGKENREELSKALESFGKRFSDSVREFNELQKQKFDQMSLRQQELVETTEKKLEKMRETVDEKLHKTLEERLGQSFKLVSERLEAVQKGLGEMQHLASGVGDLKKVLSNVKTRGVLGEIQLGNLLDQILAPEQYDTNVRTRKNSGESVEFAIKLPGRQENDAPVYLPIDAKFPQEDYIRLQTAYDAGDIPAIESAQRALAQSIKKFARDIRDKYLEPPHTTDFGIMFLPTEGLFAEIVRQPDLIAQLQREFKIIVTGPTTLASILNSLQMGFRTLALQKRSSEVWEILGAVKTEFHRFGDVLDKAQKKISEDNNEIDKLVGTRTRMMLSKLRNVTEIPEEEAQKLLGSIPEAPEED
jgi:DNA recombination protein RmuC